MGPADGRVPAHPQCQRRLRRDRHAHAVTSCAVTPDGRRAISASYDGTLKLWDLQTGACLLTHSANVGYVAIATTATVIIAGDGAGAVWFLDWPSPDAPPGS